MPSGIVTYLSDKDRLAKTMLDNDIRYQAIAMCQFRGLTTPVKKFGAHKGQNVEIEKYKKLSKQTSAIGEEVNVPITRPNINYVTVTINEYGGGTSSTRKAMTIAQYNLDQTLRKLLFTNQVESMDAIAGAEFRNSDVFYTPTGASTGVLDKDGTVSTAAGAHLNSFHIRDILTNLRKDNVPTYDGNMYMGVYSPFALRRLFEDGSTSSIVDVMKYNQPEALIQGEIGAYFGHRIIHETNVLSNTLGGTSYEGEVIFCGFEPVAEAIAEPENVKTEQWNFDRFSGIAWLYMGGFKIVWNATADGEYHIVRVWST